MAKVVIAEYDAKEKVLRLVEPLTGVKDHTRIAVSVDVPQHDGDRPWLAFRSALSADAGDSLAKAIDKIFGPLK